MTPQLVTCYDGARYERLAKVLVSTAATHAHGWTVQCVERRLLPNDATKLLFWCEAIEAAAEGTPLALLDCDTFLTGPLDPIWHLPFDIAYTKRHPKHSPWPINAGVVFVRASDGVRAFFRSWLAGERKLLLTTGAARQVYRERYGAVSQAAFELLRVKSALQIVGVPCQQWNCEDSEWEHFNEHTTIVHVKGAFRDAIFTGRLKESRRKSLKPLIAAWKKAEALLLGPTVLYTPDWQKTRKEFRSGAHRCWADTCEEFSKPSSLLDVGCGDGSLVKKASESGIFSVGLDLTATDQTDGRLTLKHADLREPLDLAQTFQMVLCWEVAEHLPEAAAETLCDTLARHLAPGGDLLFTAAPPGQGGHGHVNEQPAAWWREKLTALGLVFDALRTSRVSAVWQDTAEETPWYGTNLQVFRKPAPDAHAGLSVAMRTADRVKGQNYLGKTLRSLQSQGMDIARLHLALTAPPTKWLIRELRGVPTPILHVPDRKLNPNENALQQVRAAVEAGGAWVLLLEDDITVCADFLGSVERWLARHARADRHVYRFFGFTTPPKPHVSAYDWTLDALRGSQAIALRRENAIQFAEWGAAHLKTWRKEAPWKNSGADPAIAFDKFIAAWALLTWPKVPGLISHPYFVKHIGDASSIHKAGVRNDRPFAGDAWSYQAEVSA